MDMFLDIDIFIRVHLHLAGHRLCSFDEFAKKNRESAFQAESPFSRKSQLSSNHSFSEIGIFIASSHFREEASVHVNQEQR